MYGAAPSATVVSMKISASAERHIQAPAGRVYDYIRDFREHHPKFLPPQFSDFTVEAGGIGAGTLHSFKLTLGGRTTEHRVRVGEPEPGRVLIESAPANCMLTTFTVDADIDGGSIVRIETVWYSGGLQGAVEAMVAPRMLRRVYEQELRLLELYARSLQQPAPMAA